MGQGIHQLTASVKEDAPRQRPSRAEASARLAIARSTWPHAVRLAPCRPGRDRNPFNSAEGSRASTLRFQRFQRFYTGVSARFGRGCGRMPPPDSFKSAIQCPGGFHRFQRIQRLRFTLSTAGLYDLYTRYGQSVDKKALLPAAENYPQVPPQP